MAGFIDGEGCISMYAHKHSQYPDKVYMRPYVKVGLSLPGKEVIDSLYANFGGYLHHRKVDNPNWSDSISWTIQGKKPVRKFLQNLVNHLIIKKEQAKFVIWCIDNAVGKHLPNGVKIFIDSELKAMKRDPQRLSDRAVEILKKDYPEYFD
jgi:hypothetical protein